ncbi:MAG: hypothetical protein NTY53_14985 [Kiritimatiellaeota bacterium]|nr:hypothetical protein [Kiritimatiellota bacterium]
MKPLLVYCLLAASVGAAEPTNSTDPLTPWRAGVKIHPVADQPGRHTIHSYFNTCPESPDGNTVLFFSSTTRDGQRGDVCIRDRATGKETMLALDLNVEDAHRVACQQWVSQGRRVVFHGERSNHWFTAVVDVDTGKERILAQDRLAGWGQPQADIVPVETGAIRTAVTADALKQAYPYFLAKHFGTNPVSIFFPVLSPDLNRVFFKLAAATGGDARSKQASNRLGMVCYSLHDQRFLRADTRWGHPAWHPDSRTIVEAGNLLIDSKSGEVRRILGLPYFGSGHPSASPDGKLIVTDTTMNRIGGNAKEWGIVVADIRGTNNVVVHHFNNTGGAHSWRPSHPHPVFSPDGQRIYFNVSSGPWTQLYVAEAAPK